MRQYNPRLTAPYRKYKAVRTVVDGITFDSKRESKRYMELKRMQDEGLISDLELQKKFLLIPEIRLPDSTGPRGGKIKGRQLERPVYYVADFVYQQDGKQVVEDCKGMRTDVYKIKRRLMQEKYNITIKET